MTLPLFVALHIVYGTLIGRVLFPRMHAEGEVLGPPLLLALVPVALVSAPVGTAFMRYSGGWFLHGAFVGDASHWYERFNFGLLLGVVLLAGLATVGSFLNVIIWASRDRPRLARAGLWLAAFITGLTLVSDFGGVFTVIGSGGRFLWSHPVGLLSVGNTVVLCAWIAVCRARFATVPPQPGPGSGIPRSAIGGPLT